MTLTIELSSDTSVLTENYSPPIQLSSDCEIALTNFSTYNSIPNITELNNVFYYGDDKKVVIPIGCYEIEDLERYLNDQIRDKINSVPPDKKEILGEESLSLKGNRQTLKAEIYCRYAIDFKKENNLGSVLGFEKIVLKPFIKYESTGLVNIMSTDLLHITCNVAEGSYSNGKKTHIIHTQIIDVGPGFKVASNILSPIYHRVTTRELSNLELRVCDQFLNLVNFRGEHVYITLQLRCL